MWTELLVVVSVELFNPHSCSELEGHLLVGCQQRFFHGMSILRRCPVQGHLFLYPNSEDSLTWDTSAHGQISVNDEQTLECKARTSSLDFKLSPCSQCCVLSSEWFSGFWILYANVSEHFHLHGQVGSHLPAYKMEQSVPRRRHIKFRCRGITQKKAYNWNKLFCTDLI
jgi:hypothetical protein